MGSQHSDMNNPIMLNCHHPSVIPGDYRASPYHQYPHHHQPHATPVFTRLNSVGEDTHSSTRHCPDQHQQSMPLSKDIGNHTFVQNLTGPKTSRKLRTGSFNRPILSRSVQIPVPLGLLEAGSHQRSSKLLKSHSMPEVIFPSQQSMRSHTMNAKANRSWSMGSSDSKQSTVVSEGPSKLSALEFAPGLISAMSASFIVCDPTMTEHLTSEDLAASIVANAALDLGLSFSESAVFEKNSMANSGNKQHSLCPSPRTADAIDLSNLPLSCHLDGDKSLPKMSPSCDIKTNHSVAKSEENQSFHLEQPKCLSEKNILQHKEKEEHVLPDLQSQVHAASLSSVLYSPRKTCKKGRPSSKKQKKRQRQKLKHASNSKDEVGNDCQVRNNHDVCNEETDCSFSVIDSNDSSCLSPKISTPVKPNSPLPCINSLFMPISSSESEESYNDEEDDEDDDWSVVDESESHACVSPFPGCGFSIALNLDSIFKQKHIPSLTNLLSPDTTCEDSSSHSESSASPLKPGNGLSLSVSVVSLSDVDSFNDSVEFTAASLPPVDLATPRENGTALPRQTKSREAADHPDVESQWLEAEVEDDCFVDILQVNIKWNMVYSNQDACGCCHLNSVHVAVANGGAGIGKVRFVEDPKLSTVHIIENEDRAGTWHHFALDRERFERRIMEASHVLSPILDRDHRAAVAKRNAALDALDSEVCIEK